ncbi:MAG: vacuolar family H+-ATPase subunit H [Lachnospiraceae bacterium]|nr:vacuolar family H+-ATPase subunit H [Lachnospiraceae bacterium]
MSSKFEQMIDDIEDYIQSCKMKPLSNTMIIVNRDEILDMLQELRQKTPVEVSRYQKVISNKEAILNDARKKAQDMIDEAAEHTNELVSESEIMQQAYAQSQEIVEMAYAQAQDVLDQASEEAGAMRMAAVSYTDDNLSAIENILAHGIDVASTNYERLMTQLQESIETIQANRAQLYPVDDAFDDEDSGEGSNTAAQEDSTPDAKSPSAGPDLI